jgi:hypothetical protein
MERDTIRGNLLLNLLKRKDEISVTEKVASAGGARFLRERSGVRARRADASAQYTKPLRPLR